MPEALASYASVSPDAIAIVQEGLTLTYEALNRLANRVAHALIERGVGPDVPVAVLTERSFEMLVGVFGVLKAGGCYVPLDAEYPPARLAMVLADSRAEIVLTQARLADRLPEHFRGHRSILCLDDPSAWGGYPSRDPPERATPDNLAYVVYTSGSTGRPKGVMVSRAALAHYVSWAAGHYEVESSWGAPVTTSFGFDATVTSLLTPLLVGRSVCFGPSKALEWLGRALSDGRAYSPVKLTPAHLKALARLAEIGSFDLPQTLGAKVMVIGGERLTARHLRPWSGQLRNTRFVNEYGPTECAVGCCVHEISSADLEARHVPIGRPIEGACLYILDAKLSPVAPGDHGELYIGGMALARGYAGRPALTAEKFLPDAFARIAGARVYRSGDIVCRAGDGLMEFIGRRDGQVKIQGYRVELGEVEHAIGRIVGVSEVIASLEVDSRGDSCLVAHVALDCGEHEFQDHVRRIRSDLRAMLPPYMVPSAFVRLEETGLTVHGKIDRAALPQALFEARDSRVAPVSDARRNPASE